jgi:hypothetical protein
MNIAFLCEDIKEAPVGVACTTFFIQYPELHYCAVIHSGIDKITTSPTKKQEAHPEK